MAIQWWADTIIVGSPPCSIWELSADVAEQVRKISSIVRKPA